MSNGATSLTARKYRHLESERNFLSRDIGQVYRDFKRDVHSITDVSRCLQYILSLFIPAMYPSGISRYVTGVVDKL